MIQLIPFETRGLLMQAAAARIAEALNKGISERGAGIAALSGGGTPEPAYEALAALPLEWTRVTFLLVDERFVPPASPASNEAMLRRALAPALQAGATLLPMYSYAVRVEDAADRAEALYAGKPIDVALMGMGGDGHTASWFAQSAELAQALDPSNTRSVIAVTAEGAVGSSERLTLTHTALARAQKILLLITGADKRALLEDGARPPLPVDALGSFDTCALWAP